MHSPFPSAIIRLGVRQPEMVSLCSVIPMDFPSTCLSSCCLLASTAADGSELCCLICTGWKHAYFGLLETCCLLIAFNVLFLENRTTKEVWEAPNSHVPGHEASVPVRASPHAVTAWLSILPWHCLLNCNLPTAASSRQTSHARPHVAVWQVNGQQLCLPSCSILSLIV